MTARALTRRRVIVHCFVWGYLAGILGSLMWLAEAGR